MPLPEVGKEGKEAVLNSKPWSHPYAAPLPPEASPYVTHTPNSSAHRLPCQAPAAPLSSKGLFWAHRLQTPLAESPAAQGDPYRPVPLRSFCLGKWQNVATYRQF